jgi:hypothetical protein
MALFGGSKTSSTTTNLTEVFNLGLQDIEGPAVAAVGSTVTVTDAGAIAAGRDIALEAIGAGERNFDVVADTLLEGHERSLDLSETALRESLQFGGDTLELGVDLTRDLSDGFREETGELVQQVIDTTQQQGQSFLETVTAFQARESSNTDARLQSITQQVLYVGGGIAVVALGVVLYQNRKRAA